MVETYFNLIRFSNKIDKTFYQFIATLYDPKFEPFLQRKFTFEMKTTSIQSTFLVNGTLIIILNRAKMFHMNHATDGDRYPAKMMNFEGFQNVVVRKNGDIIQYQKVQLKYKMNVYRL